MQVWNLLHAACLKCMTQKSRQKSPSGHHRRTLSGYIFATKACIDNRGKNLLSSDMSSTCAHNMVNFGLLTAEIDPVVWGTCAKSTGFASWQRYCTASSSGRQPNFAALNRGATYAGRPSRWALTHILVRSNSAVVFNQSTIQGYSWLHKPFFINTDNISVKVQDRYIIAMTDSQLFSIR